MPDDKVVVLGLITTKEPELEDADQLKRRVTEASEYVPLERLGLSPQCGFASTLPGNLVTFDDQRAKLELLGPVSHEIWQPVSAGVELPPALSPLDGVLKRAGAHMTERQGWLVAADFGSLASELAVCRAAAGLADVSSIGKFEIRGREHAIAELHPSCRSLSAQRAVRAGDAWWCPVSPTMLLVLAAPSAAAKVRAGSRSRPPSTGSSSST